MAVMQTIGASLLAQFDVLMSAVEQAIELCPDDQWAIEGNAAGAPVRQIYHILGGLDTYCMKRRWGWDERFTGPDGHFSWESDLADAPSRTELTDYLGKLRSHLRQWVPQHEDAQYLSSTEEGFRGQCLLDEMLYILRHCHHHIGEIQIDYRLRGLHEPEWRW
jgi:hypothetical protein